MERRVTGFIRLGAFACLTPLAGCAPSEVPEEAEQSVQEDYRHLADEYLAALMERYPEKGTYYGIPGQAHDRLTDNSLAAIETWQVKEDAWLAKLAELDTTVRTGSPEWVIRGILLETLESSRAMRVCRNELWGVSETAGWQVVVPYLAEIQPVGTDKARREAMARARDLVRYLDTEIDNLREGLRLGYSVPKHNTALVMGQIRGLLELDSPLRSPAERDDDADFQHAFTKVVERQVNPALQRYLHFLETEVEPAARAAIAIAEIPSGADCYRAAIRHHSTLESPPQEIHDLGLEQMAMIQAEMRQIAERSFDTEDVQGLLERLRTAPEFAFSSRQEILEHAQAALDRARKIMPDYFGLLPQADVVIEPYPAYREDSGTGEYQSPAEDGSRPGLYYIPVTDPERRPRAIYESLTFHETIPGHHLQLAIALERGDRSHPIARYLDNSGYSEGWALYTERLADEMGLFSSDLDRMGMLGDQAARAARLVIDTGIHEFGWSRQQALDYMTAHTTWAPQDIAAEIDRYIIWPGQATAYMLGMLKIRELRAQAETALGPRFRIQDFHDRILEDPAMSLGMLEEKIEKWIAEAG